jgi:molybdopterin molybdotransferase
VPSFEEARKIILDHVSALGAEAVPSLDAVGRVLAADVASPRDLPSWDNSAMDGYALRAADASAGAALKLAGYIPAGASGGEQVAPGTAAKILTGAPLPPGADAVVPLEETEERDRAVVLRGPVEVGAHIRRRGEDIRAGEVVLPAGTVVGPTEISALASCSKGTVPVVRRPRVAILSTGDELVEPGEALAPGKIYDSNGLSLAAAVRQIGAEPTLLGIAKDDRAALQRLLEEGVKADVLITSAGVSMGDRDLVREVLESLKVRQVFWKVDIKPGRPTAFATRGETLIFSLPGNPVSTLLTFEEFVRPALLKMMGHRRVLRPLVTAVLQDEIARRPGRVQFVRVRLEERGGVRYAYSAGNQDTGRLKTLLQADGIAIVPAEWGTVRAGTEVGVQVVRSGLDLTPA